MKQTYVLGGVIAVLLLLLTLCMYREYTRRSGEKLSKSPCKLSKALRKCFPKMSFSNYAILAAVIDGVGDIAEAYGKRKSVQEATDELMNIALRGVDAKFVVYAIKRCFTCVHGVDLTLTDANEQALAEAKFQRCMHQVMTEPLFAREVYRSYTQIYKNVQQASIPQGEHAIWYITAKHGMLPPPATFYAFQQAVLRAFPRVPHIVPTESRSPPPVQPNSEQHKS